MKSAHSIKVVGFRIEPAGAGLKSENQSHAVTLTHHRGMSRSHRGRREGFTLIELLVVVAIIVILISLLAPAMDKAIYQAELTICGTQLKGIANGASTYAIEYMRYYPRRQVIEAGGNQPLMLVTENQDDRALFSPYIPLKLLLDPLEDKYPIAPDETAAKTRVHMSYELWFGIRFSDYSSPDGTQIQPTGMKKIGDRFTWYDDYPFSGKARVNSYNLLASDFDFSGVDRRVMNSHPDSNGVLNLTTSKPATGGGSGLPVGTPLDSFPEYFSRWEGGQNRGKTDSNYAYQDGSVSRLTGLDLDFDDRLSAVPYWTGWNGWSNYCVQIPFN